MLCFDREYLDLLGSGPFGRCGRALWFCPLCRHIVSLLGFGSGPSSGRGPGWYQLVGASLPRRRVSVLGGLMGYPARWLPVCAIGPLGRTLERALEESSSLLLYIAEGSSNLMV